MGLQEWLLVNISWPTKAADEASLMLKSLEEIPHNFSSCGYGSTAMFAMLDHKASMTHLQTNISSYKFPDLLHKQTNPSEPVMVLITCKEHWPRRTRTFKMLKLLYRNLQQSYNHCIKTTQIYSERSSIYRKSKQF